MATITSEPTVHLTSTTLARITVAGEVDEVFASTEEGLHERIIEAIRQLAASAGEPVTAYVIDGDVRWPLMVHPDGAFVEATALAEDANGEPTSVSRPMRTGEPTAAPTTGPTETPATVTAPVASAPSSIAEPVEDAAPAAASAAPEPAVSEPVVAAAAPEPAAASAVSEPVASAAPVAPAAEPVSAPSTRGGSARREGAPREGAPRTAPTVEDLLNSRNAQTKPRATEGWQGAVRRATGGAISPRPGKAEQSRLDRERIVQRRLDGPRTIVVLNPKGGAHKTTSTLLLAATFGTQRGGATLAWDNNETRGTLGWRAQNAPHHRTAVDLLEHLDSFAEPSQASLAALDTFVRTQVDARFDVLASDEDAAASSTIDAAAFDRLHDVLSRYYRLLIVDTGNNMRASNWVASVAAADQLVIVSTVREDTAASAAWLLDGLREKGFDRKIDEAVTILAAPSAKPDRKLTERLEHHFAQVTADVVHVPFDAALVDGGPIDFDALAPETRDAWLTVAASLAQRL